MFLTNIIECQFQHTHVQCSIEIELPFVRCDKRRLTPAQAYYMFTTAVAATHVHSIDAGCAFHFSSFYVSYKMPYRPPFCFPARNVCCLFSVLCFVCGGDDVVV